MLPESMKPAALMNTIRHGASRLHLVTDPRAQITPEDEAAAALEYADRMGHNEPLLDRAKMAEKLTHGAPVRVMHRPS
jgi:hypothetical protein